MKRNLFTMAIILAAAIVSVWALSAPTVMAQKAAAKSGYVAKGH